MKSPALLIAAVASFGWAACRPDQTPVGPTWVPPSADMAAAHTPMADLATTPTPITDMGTCPAPSADMAAPPDDAQPCTGDVVNGSAHGYSIATVKSISFHPGAAPGFRITLADASLCAGPTFPTTELRLQVATTKLAPGTYTIGGATRADLLHLVCRSGGNDDVMASSGTIVVTAISSSGVSGTFDLRFGSDRLTGCFNTQSGCQDLAGPPPDMSTPLQCTFPLASCDGNDANGCETDLRSDADHCGACDVACPAAQPDCVDGRCTARVHPVNIGDILGTCPQSDPAYAQIRHDFQIRRNGVVVGDVPCTEPISALTTAQYTDQLILLQGLRATFYMDFASAPPPWSKGATLYDWMKSKIGGFDISDSSSFSYCCEVYDGRPFVVIKAQDDANRDFDREWRGISGNIGLYAHEARHVDGFWHVSCCGIDGGCDQTYDEAELSPYGIQFWLDEKWLTGEVYVGFSCLGPVEVSDAAFWHLASCDGFRDRFCDVEPPVVTMPAEPGGTCR